MSTDITPADVLEKAAEILDTEGWCKDTYTERDVIRITYNDEGQMIEGAEHLSHCTIGSIMCAMEQLGVVKGTLCDEEHEYNDKALFTDTLTLVTNRLPSPPDDHCGDWEIPDWNDMEDRTMGDVTDLLRTTAKDIRNEH